MKRSILSKKGVRLSVGGSGKVGMRHSRIGSCFVRAEKFADDTDNTSDAVPREAPKIQLDLWRDLQHRFRAQYARTRVLVI